MTMMTPDEILCDLMRQGFMKPRKAAKKPKTEKPIVACDACLNWHRQGKRGADRETRKTNRLARTAAK